MNDEYHILLIFHYRYSNSQRLRADSADAYSVYADNNT